MSTVARQPERAVRDDSESLPVLADHDVSIGAIAGRSGLAHRGLFSASMGWLVSANFHALLVVTCAAWVIDELPRHTAPMALQTVPAGEQTILDTAAGELAEQKELGNAAPARILPVAPIAARPPEVRLETGLGDGNRTGGNRMLEITEMVADARVGPAVQFFGSRAGGTHFAFVLDISGSMEGTRFRRAGGELLRAIDEMDEDQQFYVALFNGRCRPMFDLLPAAAELVPATDENKARLRAWLAQVRPVGWTDPRDSLELVLDLNPSAIFLLSDGEFQVGPKGRRIGGITLRLTMARNRRRVPIHTIAFEDRVNRRVLRTMADKSGGSYRYVDPPEQ